MSQEETSNIILKFLNGHRIDDLAKFLETLHADKVANEDHTTLLVNCYAKMKDSKRLANFVDNFKPTPSLNAEIVVKILRQSKFIQEALKLAEKFHLFHWVFLIEVEDKKNVEAAIESAQIRMKSDDKIVMECLIKYGRILLESEPEKTCQLVKDIVSRRMSMNGRRMSMNGDVGESGIDAEQLLNIFIKNPNEMLNFLEFLIELAPEFGSITASNTLLDLYLRKYTCTRDENEREKLSTRIMKILERDGAEYDVNQAMIFCKLSQFDTGLLYLYQRLKQYQLMLAYHMKKNDPEAVMEVCTKFGEEEPNLWVDALCFFSQSNPSSPNLVTILSVIEEKRLLSPILVIRILSKSSNAPISILKDFFVRFLSKESEMIAENERLIHQLRDETEKMRQSIQKMQSEPKVFQAIKCSSCGSTLELPSVHFFCNHSFHHQCFQRLDLGNDCPLCLPENEQILKLIKSRENNSDLVTQFQEQLARADSDVIAIVSNYLSKGLFPPSTHTI